MENFKDLDFERNGNGLIPAIVQDVKSLRVLMLGYMSRGSLAVTLEKGLVTFYSRSRKVLWTKGETSGNYLKLVSIDTDCDGDTLLIMAEPAGNICHKGTFSCFDKENGVDYAPDGVAGADDDVNAEEKGDKKKAGAKAVGSADAEANMIKSNFSGLARSEVITNLISTIRDRHDKMPEGSYTASLIKKGVPAIAQKVGEEAVEIVIEAVKGDGERLVYELADLIYHTLVLMESTGISTDDVNDELKRRS